MKGNLYFIPALFFLFTGVSLQAASVTGVVSDDSSEEPISGATVFLITGGGNAGGDTVGTTTTDGEGAYAFVDLDAGYYLVVAAVQGYLNGQGFAFLQREGSEEESNIDLIPIGGGTGEGSISGTVIDADSDEPLSGAMVILSIPSGGVGGFNATPIDTLLTNAQGEYAFEMLAEGNFRLDVFAQGYDLDNVGINLNDGEEATENFQLDVFVPPSGVIAGVVINSDTDETVPANVGVTLLQSSIYNSYAVLAQAVTNGNGEFEFTGLESSGGGGGPQGNFNIYAIVVGSDTTNFVNVEDGETTEILIEVDSDDAAGVRDLLSESGAISLKKNGRVLSFSGFTNTLVVTVRNIKGETVLQSSLAAGQSELNLSAIAHYRQLFLNIKSDSSLFHLSITIR